ncbi:MAG: hypothetical protein HOI66_09045 [Verrucomicrobia bacterium]|nr:hypothetical protein [Verrucomicrobiota bacterium]
MMNSLCVDDLQVTARLGLFLGLGLSSGVMGASLGGEGGDVAPVDVVAFEGLSAEEATKAITLPDGFAAHLFASEPEVVQPIAFCLDDRGRVWVAEGNQYPRRAEGDEGRDRIIVLEDTDGDHRYDKKTVFADNLNLVSGIEIGFGGVWVGAAPYLMFIPDRNGDDQADGPPEILLDGWDYKRDTHETLNTFTWGPDGWLYGCHGVFCPSHVGKPGTPMNERQRVDAAVWRYHPISRSFEVFAEGTSNPWGVDFDAYGQCIIEACVIPHLWHMIQGGRYQRQGGRHYAINHEERARVQSFIPDGAPPYINPFVYDDLKSIGDHLHWKGDSGPHAANNRSDAEGGGHAHAGLMLYQGGAWPKEWSNRPMMNNIHGQRLNMDILTRSGSGYVGSHGPDFLNFNDRWSQALNFLYDHNGSVLVIDWYDKNQCHHNRLDGHDRSNGRIYKIVHENEAWKKIDLQSLSDAALVDLQRHRNEWYAGHARRILQERRVGENVHEALKAMFSTIDDDPIRLRVLWALHVTGGLDEEFGQTLLKDSSEYIRGWAIQLLFESKSASAVLLDELKGLAANDDSPFVRLYIASALQRMPVSKRLEILLPLIGHLEDHSDHNLPLMYWYASEAVVGESMAAGIRLLAATEIPVLRQFIARRMAVSAQ